MEPAVAMAMSVPPITVVQAAAVGAIVAPLFGLLIGVVKKNNQKSSIISYRQCIKIIFEKYIWNNQWKTNIFIESKAHSSQFNTGHVYNLFLI